MATPSPDAGVTVKKPTAKKSEALWMMTFSDLSFILMCFFALLLSMSTLNVKKYDNVVEGFEAKDTKKDSRNLSEIYKMIKLEIKRRKLSQYVGVGLDADGLAVEFKSGILFRSGSSSISPSFNRIAGQIMQIIAKAPKKYRLRVEGHTDDVGREAANWQLSARRGISVLQQFKARGVAMQEMQVVAFADSKPKVPVAGKKGEQLRAARAANRRVVIRLD